MSEYVYCHADVQLADGRFSARLLPGQVWWADHPLVVAHPDLFSETPLRVEPEHYRPQPGVTPIGTRKARTVETLAAAPAPDAVAAKVEATDLSTLRRGPGRPRKDETRG